MIGWSDLPSEAPTVSLAAAVRALDPPALVDAVLTLREGPLVILGPQAWDRILGHLESSATEAGGLLLGVAHAPVRGGPLTGPVVRLDDALPSVDFQSTALSLRMRTEVWERAAERQRDGLAVVGWFHSHPGLGAFFSTTDRRTQGLFFRMGYSVGLVVDPLRRERAWFLGPESVPLPAGRVIAADLYRAGL